MRKQTKRRKVKVGGGGAGYLLFGAGVLAALLLVAAWWLLFSESDSGIRKSFVARISVMVDRVDELADAWENRQVPEKNGSAKKPGNKARDDSGPAAPPRPEAGPKPTLTRNMETAGGNPPAKVLSPKPPIETAPDAPPADVTHDERDELVNVLKNETAPAKAAPRPSAAPDKKRGIFSKPSKPAKPEPEPALEGSDYDQEQLRSLLRELN